MYSFSEFLLENARIDFLTQHFLPRFLQTYGIDEKEANKKIEKVIEIDPTQKKLYSQWLLNLALKDRNVVEDAARIRDDLSNFERLKGRLPPESRDINRFKTQADLYNAIAPFLGTKSGKEEKREEAEKALKDATLVYSGPEGKIWIPQTQETSVFLGKGTRWCTAATSHNMYSHYASQGPLYILIHPDGTKWQFHIESKSYMDAADDRLKPAAITASSLFKKWFSLCKDKIGKTPDTAADFCVNIVNMRIGAFEPMILRNPKSAYDYAAKLIHGTPDDAFTMAIIRDPNLVIPYVKQYKTRLRSVEPQIIKGNIATALDYYKAAFPEGTRWPELEKSPRLMVGFIKRPYEAHAKVTL